MSIQSRSNVEAIKQMIEALRHAVPQTTEQAREQLAAIVAGKALIEQMEKQEPEAYTTGHWSATDIKTLRAIADEYNAWIHHHAAGHSYDDFLASKLATKLRSKNGFSCGATEKNTGETK